MEGRYISVERNIVVKIPKTEVTYKVGYRMSDDTKEGKRAKAFNFDLPNARLTRIFPSVEKDQEAIEEYLKGYLSLLHSGGHSTLYCQASIEPGLVIDFSRNSVTPPCAPSLHNVPVEVLNRSLCTSWLIASTMPKISPGKPVDHMRLSLAGKRGTTTIGGKTVHFGLTFGAPEIAVVCERETRVVIYFDVAEALFYRTGNQESSPFKTFCDWKVAILMDVGREDGDDGNVTKFILNRQSAHYMLQFSRFPGCLPGDAESEQCRARVIEFICGQYLKALEDAGYLVIYPYDSHWNRSQTSPSRLSSSIPTSRTPFPRRLAWPEVSQQIQMAGYDQVIALTETSINDRIDWRWNHPHTSSSGDKFPVEWSHNNVFSATFGPLKVELTGERKATVRVPLVEGKLKPPRGRTSRNLNIDFFDFSGWVVAFTVDLKICDHNALPDVSSAWRTEFANSHSSQNGVTFNHIYMDLQHAEFTLQCSNFRDLPIANEKHLIDKAQAAVVYLRDHYFKQLVSAGFHVLNSIPVWNPSSRPLSRALTSVDFCLDIGTIRSPIPEPAIVIVGMHNGRSLPSDPPPNWGPWVSNSPTPSHGTLAFSAESFLLASLLPILSEVNARTRIEPVFNQDTRKLVVTSWDKHSRRIIGDCPFTRATENGVAGPLQYHWKGGRKFLFARDESRFIRSWTENHVTFPTTLESDGLVIALRGSAELELVERDWSSTASAEWQFSIQVSLDSGRPRITTTSSPTTFTAIVPRGNPPVHLQGSLDPRHLLQTILPVKVEVSGLQQAFKPLETVLEAWLVEHPGCRIADPVFNCQGDLLLQIVTQAHSSDLGVEDGDCNIPWVVTAYGEEQGCRPIVEDAAPKGNTRQPAFLAVFFIIRLRRCANMARLASVRSNMKPRDTLSASRAYQVSHNELASAGVQRQLSDGSSSSTGNSPTSEIFSPTRGVAKRRSSHFRALESGSGSESGRDTPSSSLQSSPTSTKCGLDKQDIMTYISPEALSNPTVYPVMPSSRTIRSDPRSIPRVTSPSDMPRTDEGVSDEYSWPVRGEGSRYVHESGPTSWPPNPSLQATHTRPISTVATLYASGRKDTQTSPPTTATASRYTSYGYATEETHDGASMSSNYSMSPTRTGYTTPGYTPMSFAQFPAPPAASGTPPVVSTPYVPSSAPPSLGPSSVPAPYASQPPAYVPHVSSPPMTPPPPANPYNAPLSRRSVETHALPSRVNAASTRAAPTEGPTVSRTPSPQANLPAVDPTIVYPRLPPQSFFTDQTPQPVEEPVADINTVEGRRALRARLAAAAAPPLRGGDFDSLAGHNAIGVELHSDPLRFVPRQARAAPSKELSQAERKKQLEYAANAINSGRYY